MKSPKKQSAYDTNSKIDDSSWTVAEIFLTFYTSALELLELPNVRKTDIWHLLGRLDISNNVRKRLDRSAFDSNPMSKMKPLVDLFTAAVITDEVKMTGAIGTLEKTRFIQFKTAAEQNPSFKPASSGDYTILLVLKPLHCEIPGISYEYLEILTDLIKSAMELQGTLLRPTDRQIDSAARAAAFLDKLGTKGLYDETRAALATFLTNAAGSGSEETSRLLADKMAPFLFMWLVTLGHFDRMIHKLLTGEKQDIIPGICLDYRAKLKQNAARVPSARRFKRKYKNT